MPKVFRDADFRRVAYSIFVLSAFCFAAFSLAVPEKTVVAQKVDNRTGKLSPQTEQLATTTFPTNTILPLAIPDNTMAGTNLTIPVSGLTDDLRGVALNLEINHTWVGDLNMTLTSPSASHLIFQRIGSSSGVGSGDASNLDGVYSFTDGTVGDIWVAAASGDNNFTVPPGNYRTTACCAPTAGPAIFTNMNPVFQGPALTGSENIANGTWTVNISDNATGDLGSVTDLRLTLTTLAPTAARASIQGMVITRGGRPIGYARVSILNTETLEMRTVTTNQFGLFNFDGLAVENFYTMWVEHGRYQFDQPVQTFVLVDDIADARFVSSN